jgi:hypothetical protein
MLKTKNNINNKKGAIKLSILAVVISLVVAFAIAENYPNEIFELENDLVSSGYDWLVNYSGDDLGVRI